MSASRSDLAQVAQVFCRFRALKSTFEGWNEDRGQDADGHDYDQQLDEGEGALEQGEGNFWSWILGVSSASYCALGGRAKAKKSRKSKIA